MKIAFLTPLCEIPKHVDCLWFLIPRHKAWDKETVNVPQGYQKIVWDTRDGKFFFDGKFILFDTDVYLEDIWCAAYRALVYLRKEECPFSLYKEYPLKHPSPHALKLSEFTLHDFSLEETYNLAVHLSSMKETYPDIVDYAKTLDKCDYATFKDKLSEKNIYKGVGNPEDMQLGTDVYATSRETDDPLYGKCVPREGYLVVTPQDEYTLKKLEGAWLNTFTYQYHIPIVLADLQWDTQMKFKIIEKKKCLSGFWYSKKYDKLFPRWEKYSDPTDLSSITDLEERD